MGPKLISEKDIKDDLNGGEKNWLIAQKTCAKRS